jgi:hypothetical protein
MKTTIAARIRRLREMTVPELRAEYARVFGEETRSNHKGQLWRKIAWRIQALEEGGLSERARRRAEELAKDADVRIVPPRRAFGNGKAAPERTETHAFTTSHDSRLPMPGTILSREYRGQVVRVTVLEKGFEHEGTVYRSLTAVAPSAEILAGFEQETHGVTRSSAVAAYAAEMEERCQAVRHPPGVDPRPRAKFVTRAPSAPRTVSRCSRCGRRPGSRPPSSPGW